MIDTISLSTLEYRLIDDSKWTPRPLTKSDGDTWAIKKEYYGDNFYMAINPRYNYSLYVNTHSPKLLYGTSIVDLNDSDIEYLIKTIETEIKNAGVEIADNQLNDFKVCHVDFCRNIEVEHQIYEYINILDKLPMSRKHKTRWGSQKGEETVLFDNNSHAFISYDKITQLKETGQEYTEGNILRFESRYKHHAAIRRYLKLDRDIHLLDVADQTLSRKNIFEQFNKLAGEIKSTVGYTGDSLCDIMSKALDYKKRGSATDVLIDALGLAVLLEHFNHDWKEFTNFMIENDRISESQVWNKRRGYKDTFVNYSIPQQELNLLQELLTKLAE